MVRTPAHLKGCNDDPPAAQTTRPSRRAVCGPQSSRLTSVLRNRPRPAVARADRALRQCRRPLPRAARWDGIGCVVRSRADVRRRPRLLCCAPHGCMRGRRRAAAAARVAARLRRAAARARICCAPRASAGCIAARGARAYVVRPRCAFPGAAARSRRIHNTSCAACREPRAAVCAVDQRRPHVVVFDRLPGAAAHRRDVRPQLGGRQLLRHLVSGGARCALRVHRSQVCCAPALLAVPR